MRERRIDGNDTCEAGHVYPSRTALVSNDPHRDLFGHPMPAPRPENKLTGKLKRVTRPNGYAARPGSGPVLETCATCSHKVRVSMSKSYLKCGLLCASWTHGPGTDILARTPACRFWEKRTE